MNTSEAEFEEKSKWEKLKRNCASPWYRNISVEPTLFLLNFGIQITAVAEQDFFVYKACRVNNNFTEEICTDAKSDEYADHRRQVQLSVAKFYQWEPMVVNLFPITLALFVGSFSDRRGRKLPLLIGLFGKCIYYSMLVLNVNMTTWPLEYVILTASLPAALTVGDAVIFGSCYAYVSDVSSVKHRTLRVTILDICNMLAVPIGVATGSYLFYNVLQKSYAYMFIVNIVLVCFSITYSYFVLDWQTSPTQRPFSEVGSCGFFGDFFDIKHLKDSMSVLLRKRKNRGRALLLILFVAMALYTFQRDDHNYIFIFTKFNFGWNVEIFSTFKTFNTAAYALAALLAVPLMNKCFHWQDTTIIFISTWANIIARGCYYSADSGTLFYVGAVICSLGPITGSMIRAMSSKVVSPSERGKMFAMLSVCEYSVPFISGICYSQVYRASLDQHGKGGSAIFLLTISTQLVVLALTLCVHFMMAKNTELESGLSQDEMKSMTQNEDMRAKEIQSSVEL